MTIFMSRAISKFVDHPAIDVLTNPYVIFVLFCTAGVIILWPYLKTWRAAILGPLLVSIAAFFVYAYYIIP